MADNAQTQDQQVPGDKPEKKEEKLNTYQQMQQKIDGMQIEQSVLQDIEKDLKDLEKDIEENDFLRTFFIKYKSNYSTLMESHKNEIYHVNEFKDKSKELTQVLARLDTTNKMTSDKEDNTKVLQENLGKVKVSIEEQKLRKIELEDKLKLSKEDLVELEQKKEERVQRAEFENQQQLEQLKDEKKKLTEKCGEFQKRLEDINQECTDIEEFVQTERTRNDLYNKEIFQLQDEIRKIKENTDIASSERDIMKKEIKNIKEDLDEADLQLKNKHDEYKKLKQDYEAMPQKKKEVQKQKDKVNEELKRDEKQVKDKEAEIIEKRDRMEKLELIALNLNEEYNTQKQEEVNLNKVYEKHLKENRVMDKKLTQIQFQLHQLKQEEEHKIGRARIEQESVDIKKKEREKNKEKIQEQLRQCSDKTKSLKKVQDLDHKMDGDTQEQMNKVRKIQNQVVATSAENAKLGKIIAQLHKEQEKYGIEASQAHAKYYQTIEEVKIKNNQITELQKKNAEVEAKLKHQQNLYEAVRSDRNLYSKNLIESQEEIDELQKKYTRMTHNVDQFKEEIKSKDAALMKEDRQFNKILEENKKTQLEKKRIKKAIKSTEEVIKSQEGHISRLKYVIQEAQQEKQRNAKDLDMVINERDILGTQLIKRNHELNVLYEKIKLSQSNLAKGEIFFNDKQEELKNLKKELTLLINELKGTQEQISCINDLKMEINSLEKDKLQAQARVKALSDELKNPLNVHRWRKLEATDQDLFEKILKIQTLQRRLIAKTEEVKEKENLIKEKEKLFMELKNILARQPGVEIHQQLAQYKETLKEKQGQMKKMNSELKNSQQQVDLLKFENDRLKGEMGKMKQDYFRRRRVQDQIKREQQMAAEQQLQQGGNGVIYDQFNPSHNPDLVQDQQQLQI